MGMIWRKAQITILTPTHIGSGEKLSIDEYAVVNSQLDAKDHPTLVVPDIVKMIRAAGGIPDDKHEIFAAVKSRNYHQVRSLIKKHAQRAANLKPVTEWSNLNIPISFQFAERYEGALARQGTSCEIHTHARGGDHPIIPGSTIKGAILTALFDQVAPPFPWDGQAPSFNELAKALGSRDPFEEFRHIAASDFRIVKGATKIYTVDHIGSTKGGPAIAVEAVDRGVQLVGSLGFSQKFCENNSWKQSSWLSVLESIHRYYRSASEVIIESLGKRDALGIDSQMSQYLLNQADPKKHTYMLGLGRFQGRRAKTIGVHKVPSKTSNLIVGEKCHYPAGWGVLLVDNRQ